MKSLSKRALAPVPFALLAGFLLRDSGVPVDPKAPVPVGVHQSGDVLRLTFPFAAPTPAAVFRRADTLWLVFDSASPIDVAALTMMHDFALTATYVVFMDLPIVYDLDVARRGDGDMPFRWDDDYGARLGVLRRDDPFGEVRWLEIDPCYVFHVANAHEGVDGKSIVLQAVRYPELWRDNGGFDASAVMWSWTIDLQNGAFGPGPIAGFTLPQIGVGTLKAVFDLKGGKAKVTSFEAGGGNLSLALAGEMTLKQKLDASTVNLCAQVKADKDWLEKNDKMKTALMLAGTQFATDPTGFMNIPVRGWLTPTGFLFWFWSGWLTRSVVGPFFASLRSSFTRLK